jgi:AAA15 family ATPase/GTPase
MEGYFIALVVIGNKEMNETELFLMHDIDGDGLTSEDKRFPIQLESAGTVRFLTIIGPILDTLTYGKTLVVDEFGQKLHSKLSRWIVDIFCDSAQNIGGGQLIFNTHNTHLMDQDIFRRDQIYLVSRNEKGESELFSISDFGERKDKVILTSYLDGKYGAIPFIDEGTPL